MGVKLSREAIIRINEVEGISAATSWAIFEKIDALKAEGLSDAQIRERLIAEAKANAKKEA